MSPGMRPAGVEPPDSAEEGAIKSWLDALANGSCDAPSFLQAMQNRFSAAPDGTWEVLSQLDQYYRRGRIETETFKTIKKALAESMLGLGVMAAADDSRIRATPPPADKPTPRDVPVARDIVSPSRIEQTDAHPRREETQSLDSVGEPKPGNVLRRRFRIEAVCGQGAMGTVFQVLDEFRLETPGSQRLAVKVLHPAVAQRAELLAELRREFQAMQALTHPNILRVFDFDRDGPLVFFTMELLTGTTLSRMLQARKLAPLERPQSLALIREVGAALSYAHARGAVHGDLNLRNIFVTGAGDVRVMSFGTSLKVRQRSRAPDHELTLPLSASNYASCQILEGERADARDDVFSLACIAYLLLSGAHPFPRSTAVEARDAKVKIRRPAGLSTRQWHALRSALRWERDSRPADVQQWLAQLELSGAAKKLAPLNDLLEPLAGREPLPWRGIGIAAGAVLLLFAAYWLVSHRSMLPSLDSTASIRAPVSSAPAAKPPPLSASSIKTSPPPVAAAAPHRAASPTPTPASAAAAPSGAAAAAASKIELAADTVDVPSGQASAQVIVHRKGSLRGETSFTWWTESGTAKPGADFSAVVPQLAYIADGKSNVSLSIPLSIAPHTQPKSFYIVIDHTDGGATLGARTLTMVTLLPND